MCPSLQERKLHHGCFGQQQTLHVRQRLGNFGQVRSPKYFYLLLFHKNYLDQSSRLQARTLECSAICGGSPSLRCGASPTDGRNRLSLYLIKADDVIGDGILSFWEKPNVQKNKLMRRFETWGKEFRIRFSLKVWRPPGPAKDKNDKWHKWPEVKNGVNILQSIHKCCPNTDLSNFK